MKKMHAPIIFLLVLLVAGCGPAPRPGSGTADASGWQGRQPPQNPEEWLAAARGWQAQARLKAQQGESANGLWLKAADALARAGDHAGAEALLTRLQPPLDASERIAADLVRARIALNRQSASEALAWLTLRDEEIPPALKTDFYQLQGEALAQLQIWLDAALAYQKAASWLADDRQAHGLYQRIYQALSRVDSQQLRQALADETGGYRRYPEFQGWVAFTLAVRDSLNQPERLRENLAQWRRFYPLHPAGEDFLQQGPASLPVTLNPPQQVALLLPLEGPYRPPARAVEQGVLARLFQDASPVDLRVYPLSEQTADVLPQYRQAVADGADWVVGPLLKPQVHVLQDATLPVPVLALNESESTGPEPAAPYNPALFHFALSPEDEAGQMARLMWQRGMRRSLLLLPEDARGQRVEQAFRAVYEPLGGLVIAVGRYNPVKADHSGLLKRLLQVDASTQRKRALERLLRQKLEFDPRARDDVDAIFLFANAVQARQLRPQLKFHRGGHLPVFATSAVYQGQSNPEEDRDLNGVMFCDMPWLHGRGDAQPTRQALMRQLPEAGGSLGRFHALGLDVLPLLSYLPWMREHPDFRLPGATGLLQLDGPRIRRGLTCFRFRKGRPEWFASVALPAQETQDEALLPLNSAGVPAP